MLRQIEFLKRLEQLQFTGQLVQRDTTGQQWITYLTQGQILYATGGRHSVRRWRRHLLTYCPRIQTYRLAWQIDLAKIGDPELVFGWEYALLKYWVIQQRISLEQMDQLIRSAVTEVIFDITQSTSVTNQLYPGSSPLPFLNPLSIHIVIESVKIQWTRWQSLGSGSILPNDAPVVKQPEAFQQWSVAHCSDLARFISGQRTLRDLAVAQRQDVTKIALILQPCVQLGLIEMVQIADLPGLVFQRQPSLPLPPPEATSKPLIACIDDSTMVRKMMEEFLTSSGYQFLGIDDPLRAIGLLLTRKPEFIFLDLVMPNVNGYEICEKLRKLSCFQNTPIVILTSNDGYANRLRSNFVGATDFLSKPLNAEMLLGMVEKHLKPARTDRFTSAKFSL